MINPERYVLSRAASFPTLYNSVSPDDMRFKVLDQLLNVIGNGIRDNEEISVAYEREFTGDYEDFILRGWQTEHARINKFIDDTLELLYSKQRC